MTFIDTPPHLLLPPSKLSPLKDLLPLSWDPDDDTLDNNTLDNDYISYDNVLQDARDYTGVFDFTTNILANHDNASGVSADPQVQGLVDHIRDLTRKDLPTSAAPLPGAVSPVEPLLRAAGEPSPPSGGGASGETRTFFACPRTRYSEEGNRYAQHQDSSAQWRHARAVTELMGVVTRYRGVRPSNNNNSNYHATLAESFSRVRRTSCNN